jgi:hypothetical protein
MPVYNRLVDVLLELKPPGLVAVDTAHPILDIGAGLVRGDVVIRHSAIEIQTDEFYDLTLLGSNSATFASGVTVLATTRIGKGSALNTALGGIAGAVVDVDDPATGANIMPFTNEKNGVIYRFVRLVSALTGTVATGINFSAYITKVGAGQGT